MATLSEQRLTRHTAFLNGFIQAWDNAENAEVESILCKVLKTWCDQNSLPYLSADEVLTLLHSGAVLVSVNGEGAITLDQYLQINASGEDDVDPISEADAATVKALEVGSWHYIGHSSIYRVL